MRLLFEIHDNSHFVCNGHPAARRVGDLAKAESCEAFISFDQRLQAVANRIGQAKVRAP